MNTAKVRKRLEDSSRERLAAWREMQSSIVAYASAVAPTTPVRGASDMVHNTWGIKIGGPNHAPRVRLALSNCFDQLLPHAIVSVKGKKLPFTAEQIYNEFANHMLAVGIDIKAIGCPIVSLEHTTQAIAVFRLTGQTLQSYESFTAAKTVRKIMRLRERQWHRLNDAEIVQYKAVQGVSRDVASHGIA